MLIPYYFLITFSLIGYGYLFSRLFNLNLLNYGFLGLVGISLLTFISYISTLFISHNYVLNLIILLIGLTNFIFLIKLDDNSKKNFIKTSIVFTILIIFIYVKKNHDDFSYYHYPYTYLLTQIEHPLGLGQLNNGFRNHSSLFFLNSLFYLPSIGIYLLHIAPVFFLGFSNLILIEFIKNKRNFSEFKFTNFFALLALSFTNIFFYRLAEHGTDRSGMILIFIIILLLISLQNLKDYKMDNNIIFFICILTSLLISLKTYYIIYIPFVLYFLIDTLRSKILFIFKSKVFFYCSIFFFTTIFFNVINSGCLIYPATFTCFSDLPWSIEKSIIVDVNEWYELWAKSGATPNFIVSDRNEYIQNFNWLPNWIDNYFFNKVSDFLFGLIILIILFYLIFRQKNKIKKTYSVKFKALLLILFIYLIEWFLKHPALRYGGYHLIAILSFIPISIWFNNLQVNFSLFYKKVIIIFLITISIFLIRNSVRLHKEHEQYGKNSLINYQYNYDEKFYNRYLEEIKEKKINYKKYNILGKDFLVIINY